MERKAFGQPLSAFQDVSHPLTEFDTQIEAARFDDKEQWMGPYATAYRATTAIARKLAEEIIGRHANRCRNYGIDD